MNRFEKSLSVVTGMIPFVTASVLSIFLIIKIPLFHEHEHYFLPYLNAKYILPSVAFIVAVIGTGVAVARIENNYLKNVVIFVTALCPRVFIIQLFKQQLYPFSDFLWSWDVALGAREGLSYAAHLPFPAYNVWAWFEFLLTRFFPKTYLSVLLTNSVIDSLIAVCISMLTNMLIKSKRCSIMAGVLYALFPSAILYCTIGTPEFVAILFNLIAIIFLIKSYRYGDGKKLGYVFAAGIVFGISSSFKSFSIVIIVAYLLVEILYIRIKVGVLEFFKEGIILFFAFFAVKRIILMIVSKWLGTDLSQYSSGVLYHQLLVGLNTEGEGQIHLGTLSRGFWNTFLENGYNSSAAGEHAKQLLFENWHNHIADVPLLLEQKIVWAWQDDLIPIYYFLNLMSVDGTIHHRIYECIKNVVPTISQAMYASMCVCGVASVIDDFRQTDTNREWTFIKLIIFGYFVLLLIIEAQSRYKCLIIPLICIMGARCITKCWDTGIKRLR